MERKKSKWMVLDHVGKFNDYSFSVITNPKNAKFYYDILELVYVLSAKLYWIAGYNKRRENEQTTIMSAYIKVILPIDEINELPYFKRYIQKTTEEEFSKKVVAAINSDFDLLGALILKYQDKLGEKIYNSSTKLVTDYDRFSSYEELARNFIRNYVKPDEDATDITQEIMNYCIIY
ncbi:hypothetical protein NSB25_25765 [Acetatifactor muris]|uniref:Uncharacterized protein n=1 Tax=Acetatifactor muris TaxID=879566 RepID=A0A2K4ZNY3_9FIRM|nr:hypothetical protein [Acetatifactor muris]MCR2050644.1 hypothetical protein [Acetatifactor muris]SOY32194.1 hypothetical protein AMURIS_04952 [Acetatifactor muris]